MTFETQNRLLLFFSSRDVDHDMIINNSWPLTVLRATFLLTLGRASPRSSLPSHFTHANPFKSPICPKFPGFLCVHIIYNTFEGFPCGPRWVYTDPVSTESIIINNFMTQSRSCRQFMPPKDCCSSSLISAHQKIGLSSRRDLISTY